MEESTIHQVIQHLLKQDTHSPHTIFVGFEEWAQSACLFALQSRAVSKSTLDALEKDVQLSLFEKPLSSYALFLDTSGKKEVERLKKIGTRVKDSLFIFVKSWDFKQKEGFEGYSFFGLQKMKPWELQTIAQKIVKSFLEQQKVFVHERALFLLGEVLLQKPTLFASEMEKYRCFAFEATVTKEQVEELIFHEKANALWKLFDAFLLQDRKTTFQLLTQIEEGKDIHPLQILRAFRSQLEKLLLLAESGETPPFASQKQKVEALKKRPLDEKKYIVEQILLYDKKLREGEIDENNSLVPFFITLMNGHP